MAEGMCNGFDVYYFYLDRICQSSRRCTPARRIIGHFFACGLSAGGRLIRTVRLTLSNEVL
jgi:hypothetical protein